MSKSFGNMPQYLQQMVVIVKRNAVRPVACLVVMFGEHSGHLQGTFGPPSGNIRPTFREHSGHIQGTFGQHSGNIRATFKEHADHIQGTCGPHSGNIQATFRKHSGHLRGTFGPPSGNIRATFREHSDQNLCTDRLRLPNGVASLPSSFVCARCPIFLGKECTVMCMHIQICY
jgi:hypothetical protein